MERITDDRTEQERKTHVHLVVGTDSFMSGWGWAEGGSSFAAWACDSEAEAARCFDRVEARQEMKRVRHIYDPPSNPYRPGATCAQLHIYVWDNSGMNREAS